MSDFDEIFSILKAREKQNLLGSFEKIPQGVTPTQDFKNPTRTLPVDSIPQFDAIRRTVLRFISPTPEKYFNSPAPQIGVYGLAGKSYNVEGAYNLKNRNITISADIAKRLVNRDTRSMAELYPEIIYAELLKHNPNLNAKSNNAQNTLAHEMAHYYYNDPTVVKKLKSVVNPMLRPQPAGSNFFYGTQFGGSVAPRLGQQMEQFDGASINSVLRTEPYFNSHPDSIDSSGEVSAIAHILGGLFRGVKR